jgi:metallo-beta-lactamase class B
MIRANVEKLGFRFGDTRILLISHAHWDHDAGSALIKEQTGALYMVMEEDVPVVESGGRKDFCYGNFPPALYPPTKVDRVLHDGDAVSLGGSVLIAHLTPGHTKGCTTWTMKVPDGGKILDAVIVGSANVNGDYSMVNNPRYPHMVEDYEKTFRILKSLPCDLFLGAHGGYFGLGDKFPLIKADAPNPFIDHEGYVAFVAKAETAFREELNRQLATSK